MKHNLFEKFLNDPIFSLKVGERTFMPTWIPTLVFILVLIQLFRLGFWQLDRAQEKRDIIANLEFKSKQEAIDLTQALDSNNPDQTVVVMLGTPLNDWFFIIDNKKQDNRLGYEVMGLFKPENYDKALLVSRGWLARKDFYQKVPEVPEFTESLLQGSLYYPKGANPVVAANAQWEQFDNKLLIGGFDMQTLEEKALQIGYHIAPFVVRQKAETNSPFVRDWPVVASPPAKHTAYAVQWFAMALALIIIFIVVNLKRSNLNSKKEETSDE